VTLQLSAGQGLNLLAGPTFGAGTPGGIQSLARYYAWPAKFQRQYHSTAPSKCSQGLGTLCAAGISIDATTDADAAALLYMATSPTVYSSNDAQHTGWGSAVGPVADQRPCSTCAAFAVAAAAQAAVASVLRLDQSKPENQVQLSVQDLYYCSNPRERK
jgi:hypothetical protein